MKYFIAQGTCIEKRFNSLEEMFDYHRSMDSADRHFCKLYDIEKHRWVSGWNIQWDYNDESKWVHEEEFYFEKSTFGLS